jgi:hypothetical protein
MVAVAIFPLITDDDENVRLELAVGVTVRLSVFVTPFSAAEIVIGVDSVTHAALTRNVAALAPAATMVVEGIDAAAGCEFDRATRAPPAAAGPFNLTVAVAFVPLITE